MPLSFFLYYDMGVAIEVFGFSYENSFFAPFLSKPDVWTSFPFLLLLSAPWALRFGAMLSTSKVTETDAGVEHSSYIRPDRVATFYVLSSLACISCACGGLYFMINYPVIWVARGEISNLLGPYIMVLYLPMFVLAYFIHQGGVNPVARRLYVLFLVTCSILSTCPVGERTNVLLPFMIVALFYKRLNLKSFAVAGLICGIAAAVLLPLFKPQESDNRDIRDLITSSVDGDFSRSQVLSDVIDKSLIMGTKVLPYPGSGYVYSVLFFVPRSLAPFKGNSTSVEYTSMVTSTPTLDTNWGFGVGVIEEIILNFGLVAIFPGLILCGVMLGFVNTLSTAVPATGVGLRLAAIWMCGYHLPALFQEFGTMVIVAIMLSRVFSVKQNRSKRTIEG